MDKNTAEKIMEGLAWMEIPIGMVSTTVDDFDATDRKNLIHGLGDILKGHFEVMEYVLKRFPELDPSESGKEWYFSLKKKYETANFPVSLPDEVRLNEAAKVDRRAREEIRRKRNSLKNGDGDGA